MPIQLPKIPNRISIQEENPITKRIAWWFENTFIRVFYRIYNGWLAYFIELFQWMVKSFYGLLGIDIEPLVLSTRQYVLNNPATPPEIKHFIKTGMSSDRPFSLLFEAFISCVMICAGVLVGLERVLIGSRQEAARLRPNSIPDASTLVSMLIRKVLSPAEYANKMLQLGLDANFQLAYRELARELLTPFDLVQLLNRGLISEGYFAEQLRQRGFDNDSILYTKELGKYLPGPSDLVRFAVRDVYNGGIVSKYGYDEDYPGAIDADAKKLGIAPEIMRFYWRAHWDLPSPTQGYEMLHRGVIDKATLDELLRIADYPKYWRDKLVAISFNPLTRVDIRRLYQDKVLTKEEVFKAYKDGGYNDFNASKLTEWTINEFIAEVTELTKGEIIKSYINGVLSRQESLSLLSQFIINTSEREIILQNADITKQQIYENEFIENVRQLFVSGRLSEGDLRGRLSSIGSTTQFIDERLLVWKMQKERAVKRPSISDIGKFVSKGVWSNQNAIDELRLQNYSDEYIAAYIALWNLGG